MRLRFLQISLLPLLFADGFAHNMATHNVAPEPTVRVIVATTSISSGVILDASNTRLQEVPLSRINGWAIRERDVRLLNENTLRRSVEAGEVLYKHCLSPYGSTGINLQIPKGMRAVSFAVDLGTVPTLQPGDKLDVFLTDDSSGSIPLECSSVLYELRDVTVLMMYQNRDSIDYDSVTVLVTPEQAVDVSENRAIKELETSWRVDVASTTTF